MRLISLNTRNGALGALSRLQTWVRDEEPDLVALQERKRATISSWRALFEERAYHVQDTFALTADHGPPASDPQRSHGLLVASRWPLRILDPSGLDLKWPERIMSAIVRAPGRAFEFHNIHVPNASAGERAFKDKLNGDGGARLKKKLETLEAIFQAATSKNRIPRLLVGDFNEPLQEQPTYRYWNQGRQPGGALREKLGQRWHAAAAAIFEHLPTLGVRDACLELSGPDGAKRWFNHGDTSKVGYRYDHFFASTDIKVEKAAYDYTFLKQDSYGNGGSDHAALTATIHIAL